VREEIVSPVCATPEGDGTAASAAMSRAAGPVNEGVLNGSAAADLSGWRAASDIGPVRLGRVAGVDGPFPEKTVVDLRRGAGDGEGKWAHALTDLNNPSDFFHVGHTYRMQAWVRDLLGSGGLIGIGLADDNFGSRPTLTTEHSTYSDRSWHLVSRTFVSTA